MHTHTHTCTHKRVAHLLNFDCFWRIDFGMITHSDTEIGSDWVSFGLKTHRNQITARSQTSQTKVNIYARVWFYQLEITSFFMYCYLNKSHIDESAAVHSNENEISPINSLQSNWFTDFVRICAYYCITMCSQQLTEFHRSNSIFVQNLIASDSISQLMWPNSLSIGSMTHVSVNFTRNDALSLLFSSKFRSYVGLILIERKLVSGWLKCSKKNQVENKIGEVLGKWKL